VPQTFTTRTALAPARVPGRVTHASLRPHARAGVAAPEASQGRVWESPTPTPSSLVPFPHCLVIELTLTKARLGPGAGNNHVHGPPGFGSHGGGYGQMEGSNDHWFWLMDSASGGKAYSGF
jgi:hypothetical protein